MNSISNVDNNYTRTKFWKNLWYSIMLATSLNLSSPIEAKTNNVMNDNLPDVELVDSPIDITWNVERRTWIKFPVEYREKLQEFVDNNVVMNSELASNFTEDFIVNQMETDWWISKPNQLLFIWAAIYKEITNNSLYIWADGNDNRLNEFKNAINYREKCRQEYKDWFHTYMQEISNETDRRSAEANRRSAEADRRSAEADRRSAEANRRSAEANRRSAEADQKAINSLNVALGAMKDFYHSYKTSPDPERLKKFQAKVDEIIPLCKEYGVDYKAVLSPEIRKFYGIE